LKRQSFSLKWKPAVLTLRVYVSCRPVSADVCHSSFEAAGIFMVFRDVNLPFKINQKPMSVCVAMQP